MTLGNGGESGSLIVTGIVTYTYECFAIYCESKKEKLFAKLKLYILFSILYGMSFAVVTILCTRCKLYDEESSLSTGPKNGSFNGTTMASTTQQQGLSNNNGLGKNNKSQNANAGKLNLLVQTPVFKLVVSILSVCGIVAYSVFANMCYYKLHCEEIHPYVVFIPVNLIFLYLMPVNI